MCLLLDLLCFYLRSLIWFVIYDANYISSGLPCSSSAPQLCRVSHLRLFRRRLGPILVSWSFRITPLFLTLMPGLKMNILIFHACYVAWLSSSVVLMLWVSFLFCCCTLTFPRLTLYVFFVVMVRLHCVLRRISLPCRASWMVCMVYFGLPSAVDACSWRLAWPKQKQNMVFCFSCWPSLNLALGLDEPRCPKMSPRGDILSPRGSKMLPRGAKMAPIRPQEGSKMAWGGPRWLQEGPRKTSRWLPEASGITYLLTYLPNYLLTYYLLTYLPTDLLTYLLTHLLTYIPTYLGCLTGCLLGCLIGCLIGCL